MDASVHARRAATRECYREYHATKSADRNNLLLNPEVLFQCLAQDAAMVRALRSIAANPQSSRVLDVGCGDGASLWLLLRLGFVPSNLFGVDILEDRILSAKAKNPLVRFECMDATRLAFSDDSFDITMESTMFLQMTDNDMAGRIAGEMIRVTRPGGSLLVCDWRYSKPGHREFSAVSQSRIAYLYEVGTRTTVCQKFRGPLIPPVGRFLSKYVPSTYFIVHRLLPFLAGHMITVLKNVKDLPDEPGHRGANE